MTDDSTRRSQNIRTAAVAAVLLCAFGGRLIAQEAVVTPLMTKELADMPGKEALMITVEQLRLRPQAQCARVRLCPGGVDRDAGEGRKAGDADTRADVL
jgi:hypothetical protein